MAVWLGLCAVFVVRVRGPRSRFVRGEVTRARLNGTYDIRYEDGGLESGVSRELVRAVVEDAEAKGAERAGPSGRVVEGSRVEVQIGSKWYPGVVRRVKEGGLYAVDFDDGDKDPQVAESKLRLLEPAAAGGRGSPGRGASSAGSSGRMVEGSRVEVQIGSKWYPGSVRAVNADGTLSVVFDDGDKDPRVDAGKARLLGDVHAAPSGTGLEPGAKLPERLSSGAKVEARRAGGRWVSCRCGVAVVAMRL